MVDTDENFSRATLPDAPTWNHLAVDPVAPTPLAMGSASAPTPELLTPAAL